MVEHSAQPIPLTVDRCAAIFEFILPDADEQPEFDGYTNDTLNAEAVEMLKRIERLVCDEETTKESGVDLDAELDEFLATYDADQRRNVSEGIQTSEESSSGIEKTFILSNIYHLMADFYLKSQNWPAAIANYTRDLCCAVAGRRAFEHEFDSLGGLALAMSAQMTGECAELAGS